MLSLLVVNGPNLNLLGIRQPEVYGSTTLKQIEALCMAAASERGATASFVQSNHEGTLVDAIHSARGVHNGIIINAAAYTHTSVALRDAISSVAIPTIELHLSNIHAREEFRHKSFIAPVALGQICGLGPNGYKIAISAMLDHLAMDPDDN